MCCGSGTEHLTFLMPSSIYTFNNKIFSENATTFYLFFFFLVNLKKKNFLNVVSMLVVFLCFSI